MTVSQTTRLAIYKWTAGTDTFTRDQMTTSHDNLEARVAGYNQAGSRPAAAAAYKGFVHYSSTDSTAGVLSYCNGTAWFNIGSLSSSTPTALDGSGSAGSAVDGSRSDHKHAIGNDAITNAMIDANAVQADQLATDAVTTAKILAGNVTLAKIVDATAGYRILAKADTGSGDFAELAAGTDSVLRRDGSGDLAFGTIDTNHIGADQVKNANLDSTDGSEAVSTDTIQDGAVTALKLKQTNGTEAVTRDTIRADAVGTTEIEDGTVTLAKIVDATDGYKIIAKAGANSGDWAELEAGSNGVLRRDGTNDLAFGKIDRYHIATSGADIQATQLANSQITDTQLNNSSCSFYAAASAAPDGNKVYIQSSEPAHGAAGNIWFQT
jgi:hypothetical protein